jgi:hypothetical protein
MHVAYIGRMIEPAVTWNDVSMFPLAAQQMSLSLVQCAASEACQVYPGMHACVSITAFQSQCECSRLSLLLHVLNMSAPKRSYIWSHKQSGYTLTSMCMAVLIAQKQSLETPVTLVDKFAGLLGQQIQCIALSPCHWCKSTTHPAMHTGQPGTAAMSG